jgi:hypothetical protein
MPVSQPVLLQFDWCRTGGCVCGVGSQPVTPQYTGLPAIAGPLARPKIATVPPTLKRAFLMAISPLPLSSRLDLSSAPSFTKCGEGWPARYGVGLEVVGDTAPLPVPKTRRLFSARAVCFSWTCWRGVSLPPLCGLFQGALGSRGQSLAGGRIF